MTAKKKPSPTDNAANRSRKALMDLHAKITAAVALADEGHFAEAYFALPSRIELSGVHYELEQAARE